MNLLSSKIFVAALLTLTACTNLTDVPPTPENYAYRNLPAGPTPEGHSAAYLASSKVPWWIDLKKLRASFDPACADQAMRIWRQRFYRAGDGNGVAGTLPCKSQLTSPEEIRNDRFVGLALAGGGSRAAVFSAAVMFELEKRGLLREVDLISAISGGAVAASYYTRTLDQGNTAPMEIRDCTESNDKETGSADHPVWSLDPAQMNALFDCLQHEFLSDAGLRWLLYHPVNAFRYNFTYFDRTQDLSEVFGEVLFDGEKHFGSLGLSFADLNPARPNLIVNASDFASPDGYDYINYDLEGVHFPFTMESFADLHSDLHSLPVATALTATNAFPGVFHNVALRDYKPRPETPETAKYLHLLDGGLFDRTASTAIGQALKRHWCRDSTPADANCVDLQPASVPMLPSPPSDPRILVLDVDAAIPNGGLSEWKAESRKMIDRIIDRNIEASANTLLDIQSFYRREQLTGLLDSLHDGGTPATHITLHLNQIVRDALVTFAELQGKGMRRRPDLRAPYCRPFEAWRKDRMANNDAAAREAILYPSFEDTLAYARDKASGAIALGDEGKGYRGLDELRGLETSVAPEDRPRLRDALGKLHLWCDVIQDTGTSLNISPQSAGDLRIAAEIVVEESLTDACRANAAGGLAVPRHQPLCELIAS